MNTTPDNTNDQNKSQGNTETNIELEEYRTRLELLYDVAQEASSVSEVTELLMEISRMTQRMLQASVSSLFTIDEEKGEFCLQATGSDKSSMLKQIDVSLNSGIIGWVARNRAPVTANDVSKDERYNKDIDEATGFITKSVIAAPLLRGQRVIGVLEMINKVDGSPFNEKDLGLLTEFASTEALILLVSMAATLITNLKLCQAIQYDYKSTLETLVTAADAKDPYASGHSRRVKEYTLLAANSLGFSPEELRFIEFGALLHDIGKIGIDERILSKTEPLTTEEWYIIRKHALKGASIVGEIPNLEKATDIVLYHHEHYDGTGYPVGLKGEQIPIGARLVAVADAFDTMMTDHSYRMALSEDKAISELLKGSGTQFCPVAVEAFISGFQKQKGTPAKTEAEAPEEKMERASEEAKKTEVPEKLAKTEAEAPEEKAERAAEEAREAEAPEKLAKTEAEAPEEKAERAAEEAKKAKDAEKLAKKKAEQAKERAKKEAEEAKKAKDAEKLAKKKAEQTAKERAKKEAEKTKGAGKAVHSIGSEPYEGEVRLLIRSFESPQQINQFRQRLSKVEKLRIVSDSWSEDEGLIIVVSLQEAMTLGRILSEMPTVEESHKEGKNLVVALKSLPDTA